MSHSHKKKVLFVAAEPIDLGKVNYREEYAGIQNHQGYYDKYNQFQLDHRFNLTPDLLQEICMSYKPDILHYSGHSWYDGNLKLENEKTKKSIAIEKEQLSNFFRFYDKDIDCIVINACWSIEPGAAISKSIKHVVCMSDKIHVDFADKFASKFYAMLFDKQRVAWAFEYARTCANWDIKTRGVPCFYKNNREMNVEELQELLENTGISDLDLAEMQANVEELESSRLEESEKLYALAEKSPFPVFYNHILDKCIALSEDAAKFVMKTDDETEYIFLAESISHLIVAAVKSVLFTDKRMLADFALSESDDKKELKQCLEFIMAKVARRFDENDKGLNVFREHIKCLIDSFV